MNLGVAVCLRELIGAAEVVSIEQWIGVWKKVVRAHKWCIEQAICGGFRAGRLAWAFASGYQAAVRAMVRSVQPNELLGFCMTEASGNRPRNMQTTLTGEPQAFLSTE